ncbi:MAG: hypothetical protein PG978_000127 [Wolbachia endosymbiont of Ctenocephalides felis wCfeF]|nr:MAG: hypothetical protein PG978_000127 [Wolbachia endosymbiont of Ctenocephalides felis wCfeF]
MVQGGATNPADSDQFIENIVRYIREKPDLVDNLEILLKGNEDFKKLSKEFKELTIKDVTDLLKGNGDLSEDAIGIVGKYFEQDKAVLAEFLEQVNKVKDMEGKLEALGNQLSTQGVIGGAAITALTGALAGSLVIGGVTGALMGGGLALVGLVALVAIAAIGYVIYQHRGEIKEGAESLGKAIKSLVKNFIDKLPTIQARENNFGRLRKELSKSIIGASGSEKEGEVKSARDKAIVIEMLQDEGQRWAIKELVKKEEIKDFSKEDLEKLIGKGDSTHVEDMDKLKGFMDNFLPKIMEIGEGKIEEVKKKVNEKAYEAVPPSKMKDTSHQPAKPAEEAKSP